MTTNLIIHALGNNPVEFERTFSELLDDRIDRAIEQLRMEIASSFYPVSVDADIEVEDD